MCWFGKKEPLNPPAPRVRFHILTQENDCFKLSGLPEGTHIRQVVDTNSMLPVFDTKFELIVSPVQHLSDLIVGDIIVYHRPAMIINKQWVGDGYICHRIIEIKEKNGKWVCKCQGDNSPKPDPYDVEASWEIQVVRGMVW